MALFGSLATIREQLASRSPLTGVWAYLQEVMTPGSAVQRRIAALQPGGPKPENVDLGDGAFAMEQAYVTKARDAGKFESHKAYIDIQVMVVGEELMEVADIVSLQVAEDHTPGRDVIFYALPEKGTVLRVKAGQATVFFPVDGHMPSLAVSTPLTIAKTVVKIPVSLVAE